MASQLFQFRYSYERDVTEVMLKMSIAAAGAPTIINGKGVVSVTHNSAGNYSILLKDIAYLMLGGDCLINSGASAPAAPSMNVVSETVNSTKIVRVQFRDIAGAA